jgi:spore coat polysaccharide biosynthesis protein SpsF (cytidylyltransferase family)
MNTVCIIQARTGSHRLPGKVLMDIRGKPMLQHVVERCLKSHVDSVVLAVPYPQTIAELAMRRFCATVEGPEEDVLTRYYLAAQRYKADVIVRVTADCPLIDLETIDEVVRLRESVRADYCANEPYIDGLGMEAFTFAALEEAYVKSVEREHVTTYMRTMPSQARWIDVERPWKLSVDTLEDLERVRAVMEALGPDCRTREIVKYMDGR